MRFIDGRLEGVCIVHVDDFQVAGTERARKELKEHLFDKYSMKDVGFGRYCGMNLTREDGNGEISIDMKDYIEKLYERFEEPKESNLRY